MSEYRPNFLTFEAPEPVVEARLLFHDLRPGPLLGRTVLESDLHVLPHLVERIIERIEVELRRARSFVIVLSALETVVK